MPPYRCYFLDGGNHVIKVETQDCADDASAVRWAESLGRHPDDVYQIEIWCRDRLVGRPQRVAR